MSETLRPESGIEKVVYVVTVTEKRTTDKHFQQWKQVDGEGKYGYVTTLNTHTTEREVFKGEFDRCPKVSEIARAMEGDS